jgi:hypothetical protein
MSLTELELKQAKDAKSFTMMNMLLIQLETSNKLTGDLAKYRLPSDLRNQFLDHIEVQSKDASSFGSKFSVECLNMVEFMIENDLYEKWLINYLENDYKKN